MHARRYPRFIAVLLWGLIALSLSSCVRVNMALDVKADGSGIVTAAFGMTQQAKAIIASQGGTSDPSKAFFNTSGDHANVSVRQWDDGDYEWTEGTRTFTNLDELNVMMREGTFFEQFSLSRQEGLLKHRFVLDARTAPMDNNTSTTPSSGPDIDPEQFIRVRIGARLPGDIVETNGTRDTQDPSALLWQIRLREPTTLHAVSETWNWMTIGLGGVGAVGLLLGGPLALRVARKPQAPPTFTEVP